MDNSPEMSVGAFMPFVPYSHNHATGKPFACSQEFVKAQLTQSGFTELQACKYMESMVESLKVPPREDPPMTMAEFAKYVKEYSHVIDMGKVMEALNGPG
jgi:hypothetical protein